MIYLANTTQDPPLEINQFMKLITDKVSPGSEVYDDDEKDRIFREAMQRSQNMK